MIARVLENKILKSMFLGKIIIVYGARQVGKTTLCEKITREFSGKSKYLKCDLFFNQELLDYKNPKRFLDAVQDFDLIVLDEAQNIENIGIVLKNLLETYPKKQFIATGSSSFELANKINEPLTGRNFKFTMQTLSIFELQRQFDNFFLYENLENLLIYGSYPEVFGANGEQKHERLNLLSGDYLYKDIFKFEGIKKSNSLKSILQLLALQVGSEVSYAEIGQKLGLNRITVSKYIDILEQAFIIFRLNSFSRNLRNEITKGVKIYFYDTGVRNSLIQNYNSLSLRQDTGALWENFLLAERQKYISNNGLYRNVYFWRNHAQAEIDYIEEYDGKLHAYEFKWGNKTAKIPKAFADTYPGSSFEVINRENFLSFVV